MLGGQQIPAYKTIMKKPRYLPRHSENDVRLFRVISWGAASVLVAFIAAMIAASIAEFEYTSDPVFVFVIPIALGLLFSWCWVDIAPKVSRWLVASFAIVAYVGCLVFVWLMPLLEQVQLAALTIYLVAVSREVMRQLRADAGKNELDAH